jgi:hypothetical protein
MLWICAGQERRSYRLSRHRFWRGLAQLARGVWAQSQSVGTEAIGCSTNFSPEHFADCIDLVEVRQVVEFGAPYKNIVEIAASEGVDMIVMSTHGRTGVDHFILGSTAEKVVARALSDVDRTAAWARSDGGESRLNGFQHHGEFEGEPNGVPQLTSEPGDENGFPDTSRSPRRRNARRAGTRRYAACRAPPLSAANECVIGGTEK